MRKIFIALVCILSLHSQAQYVVNGSATQDNCHCYTLTQNVGSQFGAVWNTNKIDLNQSFDFTFQVFLGCTDANGADGITFVLQNVNTSIGTTGSGGGSMGYFGISPAVGVTMDTYQNGSPDNDPSYDHIAIQLNGVTDHSSPNTITPPTQISATNVNVEDCQNHTLRVVWNASTKTMTVYFDGQQRLNATNDLVNTVFGGSNLVYWGFTGATGGLSNLQKFCTTLVPSFHFLPSQKKCVNEPVTFYDSTISFAGVAKRYWNFGDGSPIDSVSVNPVHTYATAGSYTVTLRVRGIDGCEEVFTLNVTIGSKPVAAFNYSEICQTRQVNFTDLSSVGFGTVNSWYWDFDNSGITSTIQNPNTIYATPGTKRIKLAVSSAEGCLSDTLFRTINVGAAQNVSLAPFNSVCLNAAAFSLTGGSPASAAGLGTGAYSGPGVSTGSFNPATAGVGTHTITYTFTTPSGCVSTATQTIIVNANQTASINAQNALCLNSNAVTLTATPTGGTFSGTGINGAGLFDPISAGVGTQTITYSTGDPCVLPGNIQLVVHPLPAVSAGPSLSVTVGGGVALQGSGNASSYLWTPATALSNSAILSPFANPAQTTIYTLTATNDFGCSSSDSMVLSVVEPCLDPMKIFTPNGDGLYEKWIVFNGSCLRNVEASVFNRYGSQVFYSADYRNEWTGTYKNKPLPDGTYYYVLNITDVNGIKYTKKGSVTIMR